MRAMNGAMCQELILAVRAKLALLCPGSWNMVCKAGGGRGHLCPLLLYSPARDTSTHTNAHSVCRGSTDRIQAINKYGYNQNSNVSSCVDNSLLNIKL